MTGECWVAVVGGIFCSHGHVVSQEFGSQTLIIITTMVMTAMLSMMYMEALLESIGGQVFSMTKIRDLYIMN